LNEKFGNFKDQIEKWPPQPQTALFCHFHSSSSSSENRGDHLRRKYRMAPRQATHTTRHIAMPTTSTTSFAVRFRVLRRHNKPLRIGGNHHQQSSNGGTVGVPIQKKHGVSNSISTWRSAPGEDKSQILSPHEDQRPGKIRIGLAREKPIKGRGEQTRGGDPEEEKKKITQRGENREKIKRKESRREERTGSWESRNIKKKKRRRGAERESKECFIQHLHLCR